MLRERAKIYNYGSKFVRGVLENISHTHTQGYSYCSPGFQICIVKTTKTNTAKTNISLNTETCQNYNSNW